MRSLSLNLIFLLGCYFAWAKEGGEAPAEGEEGKGAVTNTLPKDEKEYIEKSGKLTTLGNRIIEHEKHFNEVVHEKSVAKTPAEKKMFIGILNTIAKDRDKDVEAYNKLKTEVKLRYPKAGVAIDRRYSTHQKKSVEELEGVAGLDELLSRTKKVIDKKYAPFLAEEEKRNNQLPTVMKTEEDDKPKRLRLEK